MDIQIKEELKDSNIVCVDADQPVPQSILERYNLFIQNEENDIDSDCDFVLDDSILREQFAKVELEAYNDSRPNSNRRLERRRESIDGGDQKSITCFQELLDRLGEIRKCGPEGNSIFCTEQELNDIQERYGDILDFIQEKAIKFPRRTNHTDNDNEEQLDVGNNAPEEQRESMMLLAEKIESVGKARDLFYELEQQVRDQVEQLELVERYKMESLS